LVDGLLIIIGVINHLVVAHGMRMIDYNTLGRQGPPTGEMGLPPQLGKILEETLQLL